MKLLEASAVLALMGVATPAMAQDAFLRLDPNATRHVSTEGTVITPSSSIPQPGPGTAHTNVHIFQPTGMPAITRGNARPAVGPPFSGYFYETPQSIACVYDFVPVVVGCNPNTVTNTPKGGSRTIAIVDAYNAPNATTDLTTFSLQFGLPLPNTVNFQVVYAASNGSLSSTPPVYDAGWEVEISLDVQWVHAMAPNANIILVEAVSNSDSDLLAAVTLANNLVGPTTGGEISMSWGGTEFSGEESEDATHFLTNGIVYFAATGDSPGTEWPSVSANVVAVGGTSVSRNPDTGDFIGEAAWGDGGGGPSELIGKPAYQDSVKKLAGVTARGVPDIAAVANPRTGVWVYISNDDGWNIIGGTSVATPVVAGLVNSQGRFNSSSKAELTQYYKTPSQFNDILQGICGFYTGYWAGASWDYCTGLGAPNGKARQ
jgi:kumamolisin